MPPTSWRKLTSCSSLRRPFEEGARVDAGRRVALEVDEVAAVAVVGGAPEMDEAGVVERRRRLEAGDVAAELGGFLVGAQHDRHRVPADVAADRLLELAVAGMRRLLLGADGVDVGGVGGERQLRALAPRGGDDGVEQLVDALEALESLDRIERVEPLAGLGGVAPQVVVHEASLTPRSGRFRRPAACASLSRGLSIGNCDAGDPRMRNSHGPAARPALFSYQRRTDSTRRTAYG